MKGQLFLEFMIAFLAMVLVVQFLVQSQAAGAERLGGQIEQVRTKMELEKLSGACNLIYFNWKSADFNLSFQLPNFRVANNSLVSESRGVNLTSECLGRVSGSSTIEVEGVRRWF